MRLDANAIARLLDLRPLPAEGGFFRETYRAAESIPASALSPRYVGSGGRAHSTQIYFLLTPDAPSRMHVVESDEVFHHYLGDPVEQLQLDGDGTARIVMIGKDLEAGERPQVVVSRGVWQGCRVRSGPMRFGYALLGCSVAPGFDWADFRLGHRAVMRAMWSGSDPAVGELLDALAAEDPS